MSSLRLIILMLFAFSLSSMAAIKPVKKEIRIASSFNSIILAKGIDLVISQGNERKCLVEAESTVSSQVVCSLSDSTLSIYANKFKYKKSKRITVYLTLDAPFAYIETQSGNRVSSYGTIECDTLSVKADGSSSISIAIKAVEVKVRVSENASLSLRGEAESVDAIVRNTSNLWLNSLKCSNVTLDADYYCHCKIFAGKSMVVNARRGSDVEYVAARGAQRVINNDNMSRVINVGD